MTRGGIRQVLQNADFRRLWVSQIFSQTAGNMVTFVLVLELFARTGSGFLMSLLIVLTMLPTVIFSSLAGIYADTFNRKYLLVTSNLVRSVLVVLLSFFPQTPTLLLLFGFFLAAVMQFFGPAQSAAIPKLVKREELFSADALFMYTTYATVLFGYTLAGPALHFLGDVRTASLLVVAFTVSAVLNIRLPYFSDHLKRQQGRTYFDRAFGNIIGGFREGLRDIRASRGALGLIILVSLLFAVERAVVGVIPKIATTVLNYSVDEIGYFLIAPAGIGATIAVVVGNRLRKRFGTFRLMFTGFIATGIALLLFSFASVVGQIAHGSGLLILYTMMLALLLGAASVFVIVAGQALLHELTPEDTHGRVFGSLVALLNLVGLPLILLVGYLADHWSQAVLIGALGVLLLGTAAIVGWNVKKSQPLMVNPE